jgi:hypothetical protein
MRNIKLHLLWGQVLQIGLKKITILPCGANKHFRVHVGFPFLLACHGLQSVKVQMSNNNIIVMFMSVCMCTLEDLKFICTRT